MSCTMAGSRDTWGHGAHRSRRCGGFGSSFDVLRNCKISRVRDHAGADLLCDVRQLACEVITLLLDGRQLVLAALQLLPGILGQHMGS